MALGELVDGIGRRLNYVRISVTDRCNFRCTYCMPEEGVKCLSHKDILRYEDIAFLCRAFAELGVGKFRFTGGEPLVRRGLVPFLQQLNTEIPNIKTALTTNGSLLEEYADGLAQAGLHSLNISLDTLDPEKFRKITRNGEISRVFDGIKAAKQAGLKNIKLNTVLIRGFNDCEVERLLEFAEEQGLLLRLIEFMPLEDDVWTKDAFISGEEILSMLPGGRWIKDNRGGSNADGPAQYFVNETTGRRIGIIDAVSNHFCKSCNRLRVSAVGGLRTCLFSEAETPLKDIIESREAEKLRETLLDAARAKPRCWSDVKTGTLRMSGIGG